MQRPLVKPAPTAAKKGATPPAAAGTSPAPAPDASPPATDTSTGNAKDKPIRSVGPTFLPNNSTTR
jgi:hypothetical protein